ncbi:MAG TPA: glycosyltransferase family 39 protein, partial [Thermoanaerobaculia bacterium]|nr:glycosyltransferase family 39 protein [Thermoanaerobaculia bacterium]
MTDGKRWLALGFVLAAAAFFHGAVLTRPIEPGADAPSYTVPALELLQHHRFDGPGLIVYAYPLANRERPGPETLRTPGYPLFLAAILALGLPLEAAVWIQHLIGVALAAAVFLFVDVVLRRRGAATIAGLLIATQPAILLVAHDYMSELLFTLVVAAALFCAYRALRGGAGAWAAAAGLLTGCATLIRPIALFWFVPLAVSMLLRERRRAAAFLAAALILPLAWAARNYEAVGVATISSV